MSYEDSIRISISIFKPDSFSIPSARSRDRLDLLLIRPDNVGREKPTAIAAAVTVRPAASIVSARMKSPGWGMSLRTEFAAIQPQLGVQLPSSFASQA
jgi:hypothetical protein